jgi:hypothetical protein
MSNDERNLEILRMSLDKFYFVIFQRKYIVPITTQQTSTAEIDYTVCDFFEFKGELSDKEANARMRENKRIQHFGIVCVIDGKLYDLKQCKFVDLEKYKIVDYNPVTDFYNCDNTSLLVVSPQLYPQLLDESIYLSFDDKRAYNEYKDRIYNCYNKNLTYEFLTKLGLRARYKMRSRYRYKNPQGQNKNGN